MQKFRIHADTDPTHVIEVYLEIVKQNHLKFNHNEESINYLPFSVSYYSPTVPVHKGKNLQRNYIFIYLLFHILLDPCRSGSTTQHRILHDILRTVFGYVMGFEPVMTSVAEPEPVLLVGTGAVVKVWLRLYFR